MCKAGSPYFWKAVMGGPSQVYPNTRHLSFTLGSADVKSPFASDQNYFTKNKKICYVPLKKLISFQTLFCNKYEHLCFIDFLLEGFGVYVFVFSAYGCIVSTLKHSIHKYINKPGICVSKSFHFPNISNGIEFMCSGL